MGKELFNQPLIESPNEPDDNDRISFGQPGIPGGKNLLWSRLKQLLQGAINWLDFSPQNPAPDEAEGRFFYSDITKAYSAYTHITGIPPYRFGRVLRSNVINNTGSIITKGSICKIVGLSGVSPIVELSQANILEDVQKTVGMAINNIPSGGGEGQLAVFDTLIGVDTSGMTVNDLVYLSPDTPGGFTNVRPMAPNYALPIGFVSVVDAVNGVIGVRFGGFDGSDTSVNIEGALNGIVTQSPQVDFSTSGGVIYADITNENYVSNDLPFIIDGERYLLNTTTNTGPGGSARVIVPQGTASVKQKSYIYAYLNGGSPDIAIATSLPSIAFAKIAEVIVYDDARFISDGNRPFGYRRSNNAIDLLNGVNDGGKGIIEDLLSAIRVKLGSNWISGQDGTPTVDNSNIKIALSAGLARQFRESSVPSFDGNSYQIYNDITNTVVYAPSTNLTDITQDAQGNTLLSNNTYYPIRIFYKLNSNGIGNDVIATRPFGSYSTSAEAIQDPLNYGVAVNDTDIEEIVYPLYDLVIGRTGAGGTTITLIQLTDRRAKLLGGAGGGGAAGGGGTDDKVRVTASDTTNDYLNPKFTVGDEFTKETVNPGANESLLIKFKGWIYNAARTFYGAFSGASLTANRTYILPDKNGTIAMLSDISGGGAATQLEQGTAYTFLGDLLNDSFPGVALGSDWSTGLPTGASVNNSLIIASGSAAWDRYIELANLYLHEKQDIVVDMVATTKSSGDGWGWHQSNILTFFGVVYYWKFDQFTGILSLGTTTAANEIGSIQPIDFNAGDNLRFTWKRKPDRTIVIIENVTQSKFAEGEFLVSNWGTEGYYRLTFLGGQQVFNNVTIESFERDFGSNTSGVVFCGDSITNGSGSSTIADRWTNVLMRNQQHLFVNLGINSWLSGTLTNARLDDMLRNIDAKYFVCNMGYNDKAQSVATGTFQSNLETIATYVQGLGYTVIFISQWPDGSDNSAYITAMQTAATNTSSIFIDISTDTGNVVDVNLLSDGVHPNDAGHELMANSIKLQGTEFIEDIIQDIDNEDIQFRNISFSNEIVPLVGITQKGIAVKLDPSKYANKPGVLLQPNLSSNDEVFQKQSGNVGITGKIVFGHSLQQFNETGQGLLLGFNNGINDTVGSNINITNAGVNGVGYPQRFQDLTGDRNIVFHGATIKGSVGYEISGDDNIIINPSSSANTVNISGNQNIIAYARIVTLTSASNNFLFGQQAGRAMTTGSRTIQFWTRSEAGSNNLPTGLSDSMIFGDFSDIEDIAANGIISISATKTLRNKFYFGGSTGYNQVEFYSRKREGTNVDGWNWDFYGAQGTGTGVGGKFTFRVPNSVASGTTSHSTWTEEFSINQGNVKVNNVFKAGQFTAIEASALTPANGDFIYVTSTDATFTSIGFWGYENGTWTKL
jgi:lysophospholipase L1-like esterase